MKIFLILVISLSAQAEDIPNYCHDAETNAYWNSLKTRAADNFGVVNLANIREELCQQVDDGDLYVEGATNLFEFERARVVDWLMQDGF